MIYFASKHAQIWTNNIPKKNQLTIVPKSLEALTNVSDEGQLQCMEGIIHTGCCTFEIQVTKCSEPNDCMKKIM